MREEFKTNRTGTEGAENIGHINLDSSPQSVKVAEISSRLF